MHRLLLLSVLLCGPALSPALAADLARPSTPVVVPESDAFNWTGGYIGANLGYSWGHSNASYDNPLLAPIPINTDPAGWLGGLTLGVNQQLDSNIVVGAEADIDYAHVTDTIDDIAAFLNVPSRPGNTITATTDWSGTVRARVGIAADKFLPYLTAGLAVAHSTVTATDGNLSDSATLFGWTAGAGVEVAIDSHWSAKAEYLYSSFGNHTWFSGQNYSSTANSASNTVRGGINYRF